MLTSQNGSTLTADIHGMYAADAKRQLQQLLSRAGRDVREIVVIHGYSHGQVLRNMVRIELKHPRIQSKLLSLNQGQTRIILKEL